MPIGERLNLMNYDVNERLSASYKVTFGSVDRAKIEPADAIWTKDCLVAQAGAAPKSDAKPVSLRRIIAKEDQCVWFEDAGSGVDAYSVPFTDYIYISGAEAGIVSTIFRSGLSKAIENEYGDFLPPRENGASVRVGYYADESGKLAEEEGILFFGHGIFVPDSLDNLTGAVAIVREGDNPEVSIPRLPDGLPGGFYRTQTGLAFSSDDSVTPVTVEGLPPGHVYFLGKLPGTSNGDGNRGSGSIKCLAYELDNLSADEERSFVECAPLELTETHVREGWSGGFGVRSNGKKVCTILFAKDFRASRLQHLRPSTDGPYFKIEGFCPGPFVENMERFWVDLSSGDEAEAEYLTHSALCEAIRSLVVRDGVREDYSWKDFKFMKKVPGIVLEVDGSPFDAIELPNPGYLRCPLPGQAIAFKQDAELSSAIPDEEFLLDWIDHACKVELNDGSGTVKGLASIVGDTFRYRMLQDEEGLVLSGDSEPVFVATSETESFVPVEAAKLQTGTRVLIGGVVLGFYSS